VRRNRRYIHGSQLHKSAAYFLIANLPAHGQEKRNRAQWRFHFNELVPMVSDHGWGRMADWRRVNDGEEQEAAHYAVKALAHYATKQAVRSFKTAGAQRIRPLRASRNWAEGKGLRHFQKGDSTDEGPWLDVRTIHDAA